MASWMIGSTTLLTGFTTSSFAEVLEFLGAYLVGRAYVFGPGQLSIFIRVLKTLVLILVALAVLDTISGRNITLEAAGMILPVAQAANAYRMNLVRAAATFDGSIQFGTFCVAAAAILLYSEHALFERIKYVGLCILGCVLALSSAPLMGMSIVIGTYAYDKLFHHYAWRWKLLAAAMIGLIVISFQVLNDPVASLIGHLTFDPSDGWFRLNTWEHATHNIGLSPWVGYGFGLYGDLEDYFDQASVDCVWLVVGLRFGLPGVFLLILVNLTAFMPWGHRQRNSPYMNKMGTGFTLVLVSFIFIGLTVHYWNGPWMLWGLFIGIRASLKEYAYTSARFSSSTVGLAGKG
jgi:hypothetical protein